jgi:hypothetical protein
MKETKKQIFFLSSRQIGGEFRRLLMKALIAALYFSGVLLLLSNWVIVHRGLDGLQTLHERDQGPENNCVYSEHNHTTCLRGICIHQIYQDTEQSRRTLYSTFFHHYISASHSWVLKMVKENSRVQFYRGCQSNISVFVYGMFIK